MCIQLFQIVRVFHNTDELKGKPIGGSEKCKRKRKTVRKPLERRVELTKIRRVVAESEYYVSHFDPRTTNWIRKSVSAPATSTINNLNTHNTPTTWTPQSPWSPKILGHHCNGGDRDIDMMINLIIKKMEDMWVYQQGSSARAPPPQTMILLPPNPVSYFCYTYYCNVLQLISISM